MVFKEIYEENFEKFYPLMAEIEGGNQFEIKNEKHMEWLIRKIHSRFITGAKFFEIYDDKLGSIGMVGILIDPPLEGVSYLGQKSEILDIAIFKNYRGKGYGSKLLSYIEDLIKEYDSYCIYVCTYACNHKAISFYGKNGYVPVAMLPDVNGPGDEGALYMRKIIR
jgi:ribosomal protein S18 acetylase RimI-like enzyme